MCSNCDGAFSWVVPTHTFSAPHVRTPGHLADTDARDRNERYRAALIAATREAVEQAVAGIRSVTLASAEGYCPVNVNRDVETPAGWWLGVDPKGFADHAMPVLVARDAEGDVAMLATADVQSSVLDGSHDSQGKRLVSGDLFGFAAMALERELGGGVVLLLPGAAGGFRAERAVTVAFDSTRGEANVEMLTRVDIACCIDRVAL